jgi:orotidine-5'-phosphate decarboxylase
MPVDPKERLIVALDTPGPGQAIDLAEKLRGQVGAVKIGFNMFCAAGPDLVNRLVDQNHRVFLDLKFHDIPNTVANAIEQINKLGVFMFNVHASGGAAMMQAAARAAKKAPSPTFAIAVTILTSLEKSDIEAVGICDEPKDAALRLAKLAKQSDMNGVVASAQDAAAIKEACGSDFLVVSPGIRPAGVDAGDQKRIMTPKRAIEAGSDYLVVGRPIIQAPDPRAAAEAIVQEIAEAL